MPVPTKLWDEISMDFITDLPVSEGFDNIWVIKDRLGKRAHFIATQSTMTTQDLVFLFIENVFRLHGLPSHITSDRDKLFVASLWKGLTKMLNINLRMSTKAHPQTDGASEVLNQWIEQYLRIYCDYEQSNWKKLLPLVEFSYNDSWNSSLKTTPFVADLGYHPRSWVEGVQVTDAENTEVKGIQESVEERIELIRKIMAEAQEKYSKQANRKRIVGPNYQVGDMVMLNRKNIRTERAKLKFDSKYLGPFEIVKKVNDVAFKLKLPEKWKIHPVFHISLLEPVDGNPFPIQVRLPPEPEIIEDEVEFEVERIVGYRLFRNKTPQYLVKWKGYANERNTWEPEENLSRARELLDEFNERRAQDLLEAKKEEGRRGKKAIGKDRPRRGDNVRVMDNSIMKSPKTLRSDIYKKG